ncbi:MAG: TerD family protein, partial [Planctomycetota bacterium]|nr:TerD family protein [Planctomycetota bacterium]
AAVADKVSTPVLLQVIAHFRARNSEKEVRAFFPKGRLAKVVSIQNELPKIDSEVCGHVVRICEETLIERFKERETLGKTYLDPKLSNYLIPFSQRSASKSLRTIVRGSKLDLPDGDTIRFFLWWKEGAVDGKKTGRVDIDLSSIMYDKDWNYKEHISYTNLKSSKYKAVHSGDITSAPNGACEFIDLDIPSVLKHGGRYIVMSVLSFTGQFFVNMPECFAGWMMRQKPGSGEIFEPATVVDKIDLSAETKVCIPVILDLAERKIIWTDIALKSHPNYAINLESNKRGLVHMGKAISTLIKPDLGTLFELHARARGTLVETKEEAETVFSEQDGITPFHLEEILADYL